MQYLIVTFFCENLLFVVFFGIKNFLLISDVVEIVILAMIKLENKNSNSKEANI